MNTEQQTQQATTTKGTINTESLRTLFAALKETKENPTIRVADNILTVRTMDPSHVSLLDASIQIDGTEGAETAIEVDSAQILKVLKEIKTETVQVEIYDSTDNELFTIHSDGTTYKISSKTADIVDTPIPKIPLEQSVEAPIKGLNAVLRKMMKFTSYVSFNAGNMSSYTSGYNPRADTSMTVPYPAESEIKIQDSEKPTSFSLEHLGPIVNCLAKHPTTTIEFDHERPLRMTTSLEGKSWLRFYIAPRVEN